MERSFFSFVWRYSKRDQLIILTLTAISFPLVYISLEIPKLIVNEAIEGTDFPRVILGFEFGQIPFLLLLCGLFLVMVVLINAIKWFLNVIIGMTGERMLRRLRFMLFEHVMRFPMRRFRTTKPGELIQSMLGEIEPLGGFIGEVIATPAFQGGLLAVYCLFIFMQDVWLGLAAVSLYPLQAWLIPKLQARVIRLNKERALNTRTLADTIGESVNRITDIHTNDTARWHMAQVAGRLYQNTMIRMALFRRKFTIKFINNFLNQLTPFFFYSVGGYLVIEGRLDFGSLVAVLAAYKDLAGPWKALLAYIQRWADFNGRYGFVTEAFIGDDLYPPEKIARPGATPPPLPGDLLFTDVAAGSGANEISVPSLRLTARQTLAVTGGEGGAAEHLVRLACGIEEPDAGRVAIGDTPVAEASLAEIGVTLAHLDAHPGLINRSIRDNILYGLFRSPPEFEDTEEARRMRREALATGNLAADPGGDWVDLESVGLADHAELEQRLRDLVEAVGLADELVAGALGSRVSPVHAARWTEHLRGLRAELANLLRGEDLNDVIEPWDVERFNSNASLLENVLFALPVEASSTGEAVAADPRVAEILAATGAAGELAEIGWEIAGEFSDLVDAVGRESPVLDSFAAYPRVDILSAAEQVEAHASQIATAGLSALRKDARAFLVSLAARFVPVRDRIDVLSDERIARLLTQRHEALTRIAEGGGFIRFDEDVFNPSQTIAENVLGGKRRFDRKPAWKALEQRIDQAVRSTGLRDDLIELGLETDAGPDGSNLPTLARRRVALARALLKRPRLVVLDGAFCGDNEQDGAARVLIRKDLPDAMVLAVTGQDRDLADADQLYRIGPDGVVSPQPARSEEETAASR